MATLLEIVGFVLVVAAAYMVSLPLALFVAGLGLVIGAQAFGRSKEPAKRSRQ